MVAMTAQGSQTKFNLGNSVFRIIALQKTRGPTREWAKNNTGAIRSLFSTLM